VRPFIDGAARYALYPILVYAVAAGGAHRGWRLATVEILVALAIVVWVLRSLRDGRIVWRRTALDAPFVAFAACVVLQLVVGDRRLAAWALAPPAGPGLTELFPAPPLLIGTVSTARTFASFLLFLSYAAVYYLVVQEVRQRAHLARLVRIVLVTGGLVAFGGIIDYLLGTAWVFPWRELAHRRALVATFANPDHFATWLAMLICLGGGYLMAARRPGLEAVSLRGLVRSRALREATLRRSWPLLAVGVMLVALLFTMSRGGILSVLSGLVVLVLLLKTRGRVRTTLTMVAVLVGAALGYSSWIGLTPVVEHAQNAGASVGQRLTQYVSSLPMVRDFPFLGVGLGAYTDIYPRYQPLEHTPASVYYRYAHSDLLQVVIEMGVVGIAVLAFAALRVGRDLVGAHCFGRGACGVGGGAGTRARRSDPYGTPIAFGALSGLVAMLVHSAADFSLRMPANGLLAATLLGIATVALHTRFGSREDVWISDVRRIALPPGHASRAMASVVIVATGLAIWYAARTAMVDERLAAYRENPSAEHAAAIIAAPGSDPRTLAARAAMRVQTATATGWRPDARLKSRELLGAAVADLQQALTITPSGAFYHEQLGVALGARALLDGEARDAAQAAAHFRRAIALAPENAQLYVSLARFAATQRPALWDVAFRAARGGVQRDPAMLDTLVDEPAFAALTDAQWLALAPPSATDRLRLALLLEKGSRLPAATRAARGALEVATLPGDQVLSHWALARLLLFTGDVVGALAAAESGLAIDPRNPELYLAYGHALRSRGDPRALDAYRAAADVVTGIVRREGRLAPFPVRDRRLRALVDERVGASPRKYRTALAAYLVARGMRGQAIEEWTALVAEDGRDAQARFALATVLDESGQADRALEEYREAVTLDGRPEWRQRFAQRLWDSHQYYQAIAQWLEVRQREPRNVGVRLALARAYVRVGERADAFREYEALLAIDGAHPAARREIEPLRRASR
jgi:tetratricopeptide (TPR) repeat protein/O-antigen ligase